MSDQEKRLQVTVSYRDGRPPAQFLCSAWAVQPEVLRLRLLDSVVEKCIPLVSVLDWDTQAVEPEEPQLATVHPIEEDTARMYNHDKICAIYKPYDPEDSVGPPSCDCGFDAQEDAPPATHSVVCASRVVGLKQQCDCGLDTFEDRAHDAGCSITLDTEWPRCDCGVIRYG